MARQLNEATRRRALAAGVAVLVIVLHAWLLERLADALRAPPAADPMPARLEAVWTRVLQPAAPIAVAPPRSTPAARPKARERTAAAAEAGPAAAPAAAASEALAAAAPASAPIDALPARHEAQEETFVPEPAPPAVATAAAAVPFEWPESTRLRYVLQGRVRGEVHGRAQVEWIRAGPRYQVNMDIVVGLPFAPMFTRRMTSDGELTEAGLQPLFYDEETRIAFRDPRRVTIRFEPGRVMLPAGPWATAEPAVQDSASQFAQLAFRFALDASLLEPGRRIELPLALPRRIARWVYEVGPLETVYGPAGAIEAHHVRSAEPPGPGELGAEAWFAPSLRYLPVRIRIRQDDSTWLDLVVDRLPELGVATAPAVSR